MVEAITFNLRVKLGIETEEKFRNKEIRRYHYLKDKGWKAIFIDSEQDYLPEDNVLIDMFNTAKNYLTNDCKWVKFKIDQNKIIHNSISEEFNFGKLRKIKDKDLQVVSD